jgi:divinyl chlorophyllide a 8-vinyl-reductase
MKRPWRKLRAFSFGFVLGCLKICEPVMPNRSLRVLLLGATGPIGRATAAALVAARHEAVEVTRPESKGAMLLGCIPCPADVTQSGALRAVMHEARFDAVISCLASRTGAPRDAWAIDHRANSLVLADAVAAGIPRFVLLSAI